MANEITLTGYAARKNTHGDIIRELEITMLFPVTNPVAGIVPTPSSELGDRASYFSAGQLTALDTGAGVFRIRWLRYTPKLYERSEPGEDPTRIDPPLAYPTNPELAARIRAIYADSVPTVAAKYDEDYRTDKPDLSAPIGTQIDAVVA